MVLHLLMPPCFLVNPMPVLFTLISLLHKKRRLQKKKRLRRKTQLVMGDITEPENSWHQSQAPAWPEGGRLVGECSVSCHS